MSSNHFAAISMKFQKNKKIFASLVFITMVASLPACGDGRPRRVPVSGTVLIDGKPLKYGTVRFYTEGGRPATGRLDKQGRFTLGCFEENDGVPTGTHPVTVDAAEALAEDTVRWHAPKKYASQTTSPLTQKIDGPTDSLKIELHWENKRGPFTEKTGG